MNRLLFLNQEIIEILWIISFIIILTIIVSAFISLVFYITEKLQDQNKQNYKNDR